MYIHTYINFFRYSFTFVINRICFSRCRERCTYFWDFSKVQGVEARRVTTRTEHFIHTFFSLERTYIYAEEPRSVRVLYVHILGCYESENVINGNLLWHCDRIDVKMDGPGLGYSYQLPSAGWNLRVRNVLSQFSDLFSEFNKYIAPAYHHDRCERYSEWKYNLTGAGTRCPIRTLLYVYKSPFADPCRCDYILCIRESSLWYSLLSSRVLCWRYSSGLQVSPSQFTETPQRYKDTWLTFSSSTLLTRRSSHHFYERAKSSFEWQRSGYWAFYHENTSAIHLQSAIMGDGEITDVQ